MYRLISEHIEDDTQPKNIEVLSCSSKDDLFFQMWYRGIPFEAGKKMWEDLESCRTGEFEYQIVTKKFFFFEKLVSRHILTWIDDATYEKEQNLRKGHWL